MERRRWIQGLIAGSAVLALPRVVRASALRIAPDHSPDHGPWWLVEPLAAGASIAFGWHIESFGAMRQGAMVATLRRELQSVEVHLCARQGAARGIAHTGHFDMILMNGAEGNAPTREDLGRVVKTLATLVRKAEARHPLRVGKLTGLLSHAQRVEVYGPEAIA